MYRIKSLNNCSSALYVFSVIKKSESKVDGFAMPSFSFDHWAPTEKLFVMRLGLIFIILFLSNKIELTWIHTVFFALVCLALSPMDVSKTPKNKPKAELDKI